MWIYIDVHIGRSAKLIHPARSDLPAALKIEFSTASAIDDCARVRRTQVDRLLRGAHCASIVI